MKSIINQTNFKPLKKNFCFIVFMIFNFYLLKKKHDPLLALQKTNAKTSFLHICSYVLRVIYFYLPKKCFFALAAFSNIK